MLDLASGYQTIGHQILDLEAKLGVSTEPNKETLDKLIEEARRTIRVKDVYTREDAVGVLGTIDSILRNNRFEQRDRNGRIDGHHLFYEGLGSRKIDCDNTSFIYLSIADAFGLPLAAVSAPKHLFVRFMLDDGHYINWETTSATIKSDGDYKLWFNIADVSIQNGVFLKSLTPDQIIALAYNNRGIAWFEKGNFDEAIADYDKAIILNLNYAETYNNRGSVWVIKGNFDKAIADFDKAISLNPNLDRVYKSRGNARLRNHQYTGALLDFARAKLPIFR